MPQDNQQPQRTAADVEAELATIDEAMLVQSQSDGGEAAAKPAPATHDYEYEARRKGWRPELEYEGPENKWVDAKTFVERGERFTKKLEGEISQLRSKIESFEGTKAQFRQFFDAQMAKRDAEHAEAIASLRVQRSQAIREGDDQLAIELEDRIDATKEQQRTLKAEAKEAAVEQQKPTDPTDTAANPVLLEWVEDGNSWFKDDEILTKHAIAVGESFRKAGDTTLGRAFLEKVGQQVRADFPRRFKQLESGSPQPRNTPTDSSSQGSAGVAGKSGYNGKTERDLPPADLAIMRQFVKDGLYTKEQFLKSYFSRNG